VRVSLDGWVNGVFILGILGVWRITHLLHAEDGPGQIMVKLRRAAGDGVLGQAMDCFQCSSLWIAAPFAVLIGQGWLERALLWPALSAGAITLDVILQRLEPAGVRYFEDEPEQEKSHVQLWEATRDHGAGTGAAGLERSTASPDADRPTTGSGTGV
jgi:hypothetical protein